MTLESAQWPGHWRVVPLWSLFRRIKDIGHPDFPMLSVYRGHGVVLKDDRTDNFNKTAENRNIYQLVDAGWLVVNRMKAWQGALGVSTLCGIVSGHYICFEPHHFEDSRFLNYLLRSPLYTIDLARMSRGVRPTQVEIDNDELRVLPVALPPLAEQRAIADYLDTETARIDALITKKRRMIELLEERHESSVDAKTRPVKGDVAFAPLRFLCRVSGGLTLGAAYDGATVTRPYLRVTNVQDRRLDLSDVAEIEVPAPFARRFELRFGDVLMLEGNGNPDNLGRGTMWRGEVEGCLHQNHVHAVRSDRRKLDPEYLDAVVRSRWARAALTGGSSQVSIATLSKSEILGLRIPVHSLQDQRVIARRLQQEESRVRNLIGSLNRQRELLAEHRQALITAAVTGDLPLGLAA